MSDRKDRVLDVEKLEFARKLMFRKREGITSPLSIVMEALRIMQFGDISMEDMLDYIESAETKRSDS
jgi:hypothetical protein